MAKLKYMCFRDGMNGPLRWRLWMLIQYSRTKEYRFLELLDYNSRRIVYTQGTVQYQNFPHCLYDVSTICDLAKDREVRCPVPFFSRITPCDDCKQLGDGTQCADCDRSCVVSLLDILRALLKDSHIPVPKREESVDDEAFAMVMYRLLDPTFGEKTDLPEKEPEPEPEPEESKQAASVVTLGKRTSDRRPPVAAVPPSSKRGCPAPSADQR